MRYLLLLIMITVSMTALSQRVSTPYYSTEVMMGKVGSDSPLSLSVFSIFTFHKDSSVSFSLQIQGIVRSFKVLSYNGKKLSSSGRLLVSFQALEITNSQSSTLIIMYNKDGSLHSIGINDGYYLTVFVIAGILAES